MNETTVNRIEVENQDDIICSKIMQKTSRQTLITVPYDKLICDFSSEFVAIEDCPKNCSCFWNRHNQHVNIDCFKKGLINFPGIVPNTNPPSLIHIQLQGNSISTLTFDDPGFNHSNYERVERIYLAENNISNSKFGFKVFPRLRVLSLNNNYIHKISKEDLDYFGHQTRQKHLELHLAGNPFEDGCASDQLFDFILEIGDVYIKDRGEIYLDGAILPLVQMHHRNVGK